MGDDLARLMFEAHEQERLVRGDFAESYGQARSRRPRRWTELRIEEQDCWEKAASVARHRVTDNVIGDMKRLFEEADRHEDADITLARLLERYGR